MTMDKKQENLPAERKAEKQKKSIGNLRILVKN